MTEENKKQVVTRITGLEPIGITNLWDGLRKGLQSIKNAPSLPSNVQAIYLLTDGKWFQISGLVVSVNVLHFADASCRPTKPHVSERRICT